VNPDLERRIAEGVADLRARFGDGMKRTPSLADPQATMADASQRTTPRICAV